MITIKQETSKNLKTKEALFVSFPYSMEMVQKIKSLPRRYYIPEKKAWEIPIKDFQLLIDLFSDIQIEIIGNVRNDVKVEADTRVIFAGSPNISYKHKTTPYQHQIEGLAYSLQNNKFLLGDEQGLGKSKQAIDAAVARKGQFKHCLIIAGVNGIKWNWLKEITIHSDEKGHLLGGRYYKGKLKEGSVAERLEDLRHILAGGHNYDGYYFLVTNIETLRSKEIQECIKQLTKQGIIGMSIIDEIQKAKNPSSSQGKGIMAINSFYKMAMTGTPLMNRPLDVYNILKWIDVEKNSFYSFKNRYCVMGGYGGYEVVGYKNMQELQKRLSGCMLRRLKKDVLDLPEKIRVTEYVEMGAKQEKIYKDILRAIREEIDLIKMDSNPLAQLIRLRQATAHTSILSSSVAESAKMERVDELIDDIIDNNEKALIYSNWTSVIELLAERLTARGIKYGVITGDVSTEKRMEEVNAFQNTNEVNIMLGTIGAMGTGLTLTAATNVIFLDSPWNMATKEQAEDRAHRIGTTESVNIITLVAKNTIDEKIEEILIEKKIYSDALVDGKMGLLERAKMVDFLLS